VVTRGNGERGGAAGGRPPFPGPDDVPDLRLVPDHAFSTFDWRDVDIEGADFAIEMDVTPRVVNSSGALQGGLMAVLVDLVAGRALLKPPSGFTKVATTELHLDFLEPARDGPVRAEAHVLRRGRRSAVVRVEVHDVNGRLVATATLSFAAPTGGR